MGVENLCGTPWHVERITRAEGDDRRHRSHCEFYRKGDGHCSKYNGVCHGSAHCPLYSDIRYKDRLEDECSNNHARRSDAKELHFYPGCRVQHRTFGYGIVELANNISLVVFFDGCGKKVLKTQVVLQLNLLVRVKN